MIPKKLRLKNFIGIKSGLGLDEITIDLTTLPEDAQIIALHGENGKGKSTVLDNLHCFRLMPSRANSYSPGSFSYYDNTYGDAEKELIWEHQGQQYRTTIKIKGSIKTKKTEAYLHIMTPDGYQPAPTGEGDAVSDGKTVTYDKAVERVLGSPEMFFTSAFSSQGKKPLSTYTNGEVKGLMSELLGLEHITDLGENANEVVKGLIARVNGMQQSLVLIKTTHDDLDKCRNNLDEIKAMLGLQTQGKYKAREQLQNATNHLASVKSENGAKSQIEDRRRELSEKLRTTTKAADNRLTELNVDLSRLQIDAEALNKAHGSALERFRVSINTAENEIKQCQEIISLKDEIAQAVESTKSFNEALMMIDADFAAETEKVNTRARYQTTIDALKGELTTKQNAINSIETHLKSLETQASLIDEVPCSGTEMQESCKLLENAKEAKNQIDRKQRELSDARIDFDSIQERIQNGTNELQKFAGLDEKIKELTNHKASIQADIDAVSHLVIKATSLEVAESAMYTSSARLSELNNELAHATEEYDNKIEAINERISELTGNIATTQLAKSQSLESIQVLLSQLPDADDNDLLQKAQDSLRQAEQNLRTLEQQVDDSTETSAAISAKIKTMEEDLRKSDQLQCTIKKLNAEISKWKLLTMALGKDGIIALSIDDAGPTIASLANEILLKCYGPRFTVSIDTQSQNQSGTMKETFDIIVFDGEQDEKKSIRTMSGGERVWINECITRAIALYQAQQSGKTYGTLFTDETDGALDPARKSMFMKMKRTVLELGNYEKEFFITHTPELLDLADAVIDLNEFINDEAAA